MQDKTDCMNIRHFILPSLMALAIACKKNDKEFYTPEKLDSFREISSIDIGDAGAAEITAFDPVTKKLFVVNNGATNKIDIIDFKDPSTMNVIGSISMEPFGGFVNSVAVSNGLLAAAIESVNKQQNGKVVVFKTSDYSVVKEIIVGALPDMVTFSPDGKYILSANEGEPSGDYTNDPVGSVSLVSVKDNYAVTTLGFANFSAQREALAAKGLRIFGLNAGFENDIEPEYITITEDSRFAFVTLQENNAIAKIDIQARAVTDIMPLGFKSYYDDANGIDPSDRDNMIAFSKQPLKGMYLPDAIKVYEIDGQPLLFTANEGDAREYQAYTENKRLKDLTLDPTVFPDAATLKTDARLGRLNVFPGLGDTDKDGDLDEIYSYGARSFSIWNGRTGVQVWDSKNELDRIAKNDGIYDDGRSDDKSVEPEGIELGKIGRSVLAFVGLERADAVAVYNVTNPYNPQFLQLLKTGDAPEGVLFISAKDSPTKKSLLIVSSENDGQIKVYSPDSIK